MLNITRGKIDRALKLVAYGSEGIGKTTFTAAFPEPLFIDTEGVTAHMDVRRIDRPQSWEELLSIISEIAADPNVCKTFVLDTADWAEALCIALSARNTSRTPSRVSATAKATRFSARSSAGCLPLLMPSSRRTPRCASSSSPMNREPTTNGK